MMGDLRGRTALITGASRGIGLSIARDLAAAGVEVALVARSEDALRRAAGPIAGHPIPADVSDADAVAELPGRAHKALGGAPDIVINAAGAFDLGPIVDTDPEDFARQVSVNLIAPFLVARAFLPAMLERGSGHIVNIGSIAGRVPLPGNGAYGASKYGLRGFHEVLAQELTGTGVRATLVEPAATDTPLWDPVDPDSSADLPSRAEMLRPEHVSRGVLYAVSQPAGVEVSLLAIRRNG